MTLPRPPAALAGPARLTAQLQAVAAAGDRAAFAELFGYFAPRIKAYFAARGCAAAEAEELAQETMVTVWRRAASFDPAKAAASTWIFTIARNKRIDAVRRERRPEIDPDDPALAPADPGSADQAVHRAEQAERLAQAIAGLPEAQAALIRMAYFEDKAHGQIAAETALPLGTVKSRLRLALGRLRKALGEDA